MPRHTHLPALPLPGLESHPTGSDNIYRVVLAFGGCGAFLGREAPGGLRCGGYQAGATDLSMQAPKNSWHRQFGASGCIFGWPGVGLAACPRFAWLPLSAPHRHHGGAGRGLWHGISELECLLFLEAGLPPTRSRSHPGMARLTSTDCSLPTAIAGPTPEGWLSPRSFPASWCPGWLPSPSQSSAAASGPCHWCPQRGWGLAKPLPRCWLRYSSLLGLDAH